MGCASGDPGTTFGTLTSTAAQVRSGCQVRFGSNDSLAELRLVQSDGVGTALATVPDFVQGTADWSVGTGAFGACLANADEVTVSVWNKAGASGCVTSDATLWQGVAAGTTGSTALLAQTTTTGVVDADIELSFGVRAGSTIQSGTLGGGVLLLDVIAAVPPVAPAVTIAPAIVGTPRQGQSLTVSNGTWSGSPTTYARQWTRCDGAGNNCTDITGATSSSYLVDAADVGSTLRARVTAANAGGATTATTTQTPTIVPPAPTNTALQLVTGVALEGEILTTSTGTWTGSPTYAYQWQRCNSMGAACSDIPGATAGTYRVSAADVEFTLRSVVTATNAGGSGTANSATTDVAQPRMPVGTIIPWDSGGTVPAGWLVADGAAVSRTTWADLWDALRAGGTTSPYGNGDGSTTFNVPDMRSRFPIGRSVVGSPNERGDRFGAATHTHGLGGLASIPVHSHGFQPDHNHPFTTPNHRHQWDDPGGGDSIPTGAKSYIRSDLNLFTGYAQPSGTTTMFDDPLKSTGNDGQTVTNFGAAGMPAYEAVTYIVRAEAIANSTFCNAVWITARATAPAGTVPADGTTTSSCTGVAKAPPNLAGRLPLGVDSPGAGAAGPGTTYPLGARAGALDRGHAVTISASAHNANIPGHTHGVTLPNHRHDVPQSCLTCPSISENGAGSTFNAWKWADPTTSLPNTSPSDVTSSNSEAILSTSNASSASTDTDTPPYQSLMFTVPTATTSTAGVGTIVPYAGAIAPLGWVFAEGQVENRTGTYAVLWQALSGGSGTSPFGNGNGTTTFRLPDLRDRYPLGDDATHTRGTTGSGALSHTHVATVNNHTHVLDGTHTHAFTLPNHTHDVTVANFTTLGGGGTCNGCFMNEVNPALKVSFPDGDTVGRATAAPSNITTQSDGAGSYTTGASTNLPPSLTVRFIIKI